MNRCTAGHAIPADATFCPACGAPSRDRRTDAQRRADQKSRRVIFIVVGVLVVGVVAASALFGDDDKTSSAEQESSNRSYAQYLCEESMKRGADPVDVDFGDYSDATVTGREGAYVVTDRARVGFDVVSYRCEVTRAGEDDWTVESIDVD